MELEYEISDSLIFTLFRLVYEAMEIIRFIIFWLTIPNQTG